MKDANIMRWQTRKGIMSEITISITYKKTEWEACFCEIIDAKDKYVPKDLTLIEIHWDKNWTAEFSRVTFKGVEK